jgi:hypothetical protein
VIWIDHDLFRVACNIERIVCHYHALKARTKKNRAWRLIQITRNVWLLLSDKRKKAPLAHSDRSRPKVVYRA